MIIIIIIITTWTKNYDVSPEYYNVRISIEIVKHPCYIIKKKILLDIEIMRIVIKMKF